MPSQPVITTARECSPPPRHREPWPPSSPQTVPKKSKTLSSRLVFPTGSVLVPHFGELFLAESRAELDQCWPQTAMHVRNLASTSLQTRTLGLSQIASVARKIPIPFGMTHQLPRMGTPTIALCEIWKRATSGLKDDSVTFNKCERFLLVHDTSSPIASRPANENKISCDWQERAPQNR
jgi:hypothetical protein